MMSSDKPRGGYAPLTEQRIEELRAVIVADQENWPSKAYGKEIETLCAMAVNCLLYAGEIHRLRDAPLSARPERMPVTPFELQLLAAGWVMEIAGAHRDDRELFEVAKAFSKQPHAEDDTEVVDILRRILLPEGRRSPLAGAPEGGSPLEAARDANPSRAGDGGVAAPSYVNDSLVTWLEDELLEVMRLASKGLFGDDKDDAITDTLRLHGIRLLVEADTDRYEALLERVQKRRAISAQRVEGKT